MERQIKFRAWDEGNKIMHEDFQFIRSGEEGNDWIVFTSDKQTLKDKQHPLENPYFQQQLKIMEWAGIENIFEGDIVTLGENDGQGVVQYDEDRFYVDYGTMRSRVSKLHKIIGNIYENSERPALKGQTPSNETYVSEKISYEDAIERISELEKRLEKIDSLTEKGLPYDKNDESTWDKLKTE